MMIETLLCLLNVERNRVSSSWGAEWKFFLPLLRPLLRLRHTLARHLIIAANVTAKKAARAFQKKRLISVTLDLR